MKPTLIKTIILLGLITAIISFAGCKRFSAGNWCEVDFGDITIHNYHDNPYNLYIDDIYNSVMQPWDTLKLDLHYGTYVFKLEQVSGYDSFPNILEDKIPIDACTSIGWGPK